jgi:hypothetical protein
MVTKPATMTAWLSGFTDTGVTGVWRDNSLALVPYALYGREAGGGDQVSLEGAAVDFVVLVK